LTGWLIVGPSCRGEGASEQQARASGAYDVGAQSAQAHTTASFADALGYGYAYGSEFIELGLGDKRERQWHAGEENAVGYCGHAMFSRADVPPKAINCPVDLGPKPAWRLVPNLLCQRSLFVLLAAAPGTRMRAIATTDP
jgi:hypothetical protein